MKQKTGRILQTKGIDYIFVFFALLILGICFRENQYEMRILQDDISMMILPAKLAGYNWPNVLDIAMYYGTGYYVLFTPLFACINDPIVLYNVIIDINIAVVALCGVLLHYLLCGVLEYKDKWCAAIVSIVSVMIAYFDMGSGLTNEMPILLLSILLMILVGQFVKTVSVGKRIFIAIVAIVLSVYSMTIHSRNIVLAVALFGVVFLMILLQNKNDDNRYFAMLCMVEFLGFSYLMYKFVPELIASGVYSASEESGTMWNQEITMRASTFDFEFINNVWTLFVGNVVASIKNTYGLILVSYILMIKLAWTYIKLLFNIPQKGKGRTEEEIFQSKAVEYVFVFSAVCYVLGLLGLSVTWAGMPRGTGYWRYYGTYSSGMIAVSFMYMVQNKLALNKIKKRTSILTAVLLCCFFVWVLPFLNDTEYLDTWFVYSCFESIGGVPGFLLTVLVFVVGIAIIFWTRSKPVLWFAVCFFAIQTISEFGGGHLTSIEANSKCDTGYKLIQELEKTQSYNAVYFTGSDSAYMAYQYMMLDKPVFRGVPGDAEGVLVFSNLKNAIESGGWYRVKIDSNEYVYSRDPEMLEMIYSVMENIEGAK